MKVIEKIYAGIFVLAIVGVTVLLNSPIVRSGNTLGEITQQEYNDVKFDESNFDLAIEDELEDE